MECDVAIIGAGPAGATTALWLARAGWRVVLLDKARFPRDKICGEALSPGALPVLERLGLRAAVESAGRPLGGAVIRSADGGTCIGRYPHVPGMPEKGVAIARWTLDPLLLDAARREPTVTVLEGTTARALRWDGPRCVGVDTSEGPILSRAVVLAEGRLGSLNPAMRRTVRSGETRRMAFVATFKNVQGLTDMLELDLRNPHLQTVLSPQGPDTAALCAVVTGGPAAPLGASPRDGLLALLREDPNLAARLLNAEPTTALKGMPLAPYACDPAPADGLVVVGDGLCHFDPLTGEGMYRAFRSAELAGETLNAALDAQDLSRERLRAYARRVTSEFRWTYRFVDSVVALTRWERAANLAVRGLAANPALASRMVAYQGAMLPAERFFPDMIRTAFAAF